MRAGYQSLAHSQSRLIIHSAHVSIPHLTVLFNKQKPHKSQPASTPKLMGVARLALLIYVSPAAAQRHSGKRHTPFWMPQHVELVRHFLKLIFSQQARTSANADRGVEGGKSTGWRLFKWLEIIMCLHPFSELPFAGLCAPRSRFGEQTTNCICHLLHK